MKHRIIKSILPLMLAILVCVGVTPAVHAEEGETYTVTYEWFGDIPDGATLPYPKGAWPGEPFVYEKGDSHSVNTTIKAGDHEILNSDSVIIGYDYFSGWSMSGSFEVDQDYVITGTWTHRDVPSYTITYTDGASGAAFANQTYSQYENATTPAFNGSEPTRSGYTFNGWSPAVAGTVTGDVTYTAQWTKVEEKTEEPAKNDNTKSDETKTETKPAETKPAETKPAETKPAETKPAEPKSTETKSSETKTETPAASQNTTKSETSNTPKTPAAVKPSTTVNTAPQTSREEVSEAPEESAEEEEVVEESAPEEEPEEEQSEPVEEESEVVEEEPEEEVEEEIEAIEEDEVPLAAAEEVEEVAEEIQEEEVPEAFPSTQSGSFAILNLLAMLATIGASVLLFLQKDVTDQRTKLIGLIPAGASILVFFLTQRFQTIRIADIWTIPLAAFLAVGAGWLLYSKKKEAKQ